LVGCAARTIKLLLNETDYKFLNNKELLLSFKMIITNNLKVVIHNTATVGLAQYRTLK